jgi:WD40 repeat protein
MGFKIIIRASILAIVIFSLCSCTTSDTQSGHSKQTATVSVLTESRRLSGVSQAYLDAQKDQSKQSVHPTTEFAKNGSGVAYIEHVDGNSRVVYNGVPGKLYQVVGDLAFSSVGSRIAYVAHKDDKFKKIIVDGWEGPLFTEIGMPVFSPDGKHHMYTVTEGENTYGVIDHKVRRDYKLTRDPVFSPDSRFIAFSARTTDGLGKQLILSDLSMQDKKVFDSCGESFIASDDGTRLAVVCTEGDKLSVKILDFQTRSHISSGQVHTGGKIARMRFAPDNRAVAYTFVKSDSERYVVYKDRIEKIPTGDEFLSDLLVLTEPEHVGVVIGTAVNARLYNAFQMQKFSGKSYGYISDLVSSKDGRHFAYIAIKAGGEERMSIVVDGNEGQLFDKIVSPVFSPDGRFLVYRARQDGKRFIVISDLKGKVLSQHKEYEMVFQPVFTEDGKSVAYGVLDGSEFWWKVEKL